MAQVLWDCPPPNPPNAEPVTATKSPRPDSGKARAAIILAAGQGTRMKSALPKVMHPVGGIPMIGHMVAALKAADVARIVAVIAPGQESVASYLKGLGVETVIQDKQLGTGHAAACAASALKGFKGDAFVFYGDTPLLTPETIRKIGDGLTGKTGMVVVAFRPADPGAYGRLIQNKSSGLEAIVEAKDATRAQLKIGLCNAGGFHLSAPLLFDLLKQVGNSNAQGEYYLTDIVRLARKRKLACCAVEAPVEDVMGVNARSELAAAEAVFQDRARARAMANGATLSDPRTVYFSADTRLGRDVVIGPNVLFGPGVTVADNVTIRGFCHIEGARIASGAIIGPFARLRPGTVLHEDVHIGNFVETKASEIGKGAKANDASVGAGANIGAGTITCNYDGFDKYRTDIGAGAFIGSNTALVAPVTVGEGAYVGAGSVIAKDVSANALAVERSQQKSIDGWAEKFRARKRAEKAAKAKPKA